MVEYSDNASPSPLFGVIILVTFPTICKHHLLTALGTVTLYKQYVSVATF